MHSFIPQISVKYKIVSQDQREKSKESFKSKE